ncbi:universal stress protein [Aureibaculum sp. 2210JD6-5]|uniref:universal stress protein n=1 Tax=Aureibaculum sp. 2210JD6-5 TaxID=3103957 RepID=UPI002AAEE1C6|nr:universal stress protein [Aureibaculum sp. 2210JD6-5]MDY7396434.1 universal stress protein [Aureibaculum sp. 2210JD6-5]
MKKILVPIDFSDEAMYACKVAASIAKKTGGEIILLHMLDIPTDAIDPIESDISRGGAQTILFMKGIHKRFEKLKKQPFFDGIKLNENVKFHKAFEGVIEESRTNDVDLIVMGSQGATGLKEMLVGSNTEKVVRQSHIPVLVIKQDVENFKIDDIIFASDFSEESKKSFQDVIDFANTFNAKLHLLFINTARNFEPTEVTNAKLKYFIGDFDLKNYTLNTYNDVTIEEGILNFGKKIDADIIAINTHGRSGLAQLFNESISKDLANHALRPVVTFKI